MRKKIIAGNWKMNKTASEAAKLVDELIPAVKDASCEVVICTPFTDLVTAVEKTKGTNTAYLEFQTPLWIKLAIAVSLLGQFAAVVWGLLWRGGFFKKREEKKA